ncbi:type VII secretion-associated serine protease mycosin [Actinoplanes octamycinicus]|uniref:Type VII secretion-associated serine protease mycosin n=2 Tax=Actinoplanes octamycinicus TaxID=135948 RepID=A0A7W7GSI7_9ACTN|nr:type VII secretion-associated serine protease mycosin [Actinoplanes octamycinicus]
MLFHSSTACQLGPHISPVSRSTWFVEYLQLNRVHELSTGAGVAVGIPDSGVHPHPDLSGSIATGSDIVEGGDGRGQVDQIGHGTHMAGLIASHGTGRDAIGVAPGTQIIPIKIFGSTEKRPQLSMAIEWLQKKRAQVINISLSATPSNDLIRSIRDAASADIVIVASAGSSTKDARVAFPASMPEVVAVGAINESGQPASFSPHGPAIDLCAPGVDIRTTGVADDYVKVDGTSPAAAIVSGAAALVRARFPGLSAREVVHRLTATATDIGAPGWDEQCGYGVLNIVKALTADVAPLPGSPARPPSAGVGTSSAETSADGNGSAGHNGGVGQQDGGGSRQRVGILGGIAAVLVGGVFLGFLAARRRNRRQP